MFTFFKKNKNKDLEHGDDVSSFEVELTASVLAYEIARIDGEISDDELSILMQEIEAIAVKVDKDKDEILNIIENYSNNSVSFYEFVEDINKHYSKENKLELLGFMWRIAYADGKLDVDEERLIRRLAALIRIKDMDVLKLKTNSKINIQ